MGIFTMNIIYLPCKDLDEAQKIATKLLEMKLAFCTNIIPSVFSIYRWKGRIEKINECLLLIKTKQELVSESIKLVKKIHSYELPEVIWWDVETTKNIRNWIKTELKL